MIRYLSCALALLSIVLSAGCAGRGPAGRANAEELAAWVSGQSYSTWSTFKRRDHAPNQPDSPDGLTLGSPNIFAAIGCNQDDLTTVDVLWCDQRTARPLARPLTVALATPDSEPSESGTATGVPLGSFSEQTLQRVRHTSIAVSRSVRDDLRVTCVDFAPMNPEDNFLVRWFLVENTGQTALRPDLSFHIMAPGEWTSRGSHMWQLGDRLAFLSDTRLLQRDETVQAVMGRLRPGEKASAALLIVAVEDSAQLPEDLRQAEAALENLPQLLEDTKSEWTAWCAQTPLTTGHERTDDLLDSLLCLVRSHIGPQAIHTGSLRYPHNRAWVRDSYWVQRALLELGRPEGARLSLDFFHRAWRAAGLASAYQIPDGDPTSWGYSRVELPHYLVLMVRDADQLGGADPMTYWDMVQGCLDAAAVPDNGLQPMNGDETWILAAPVRELDDLIDNSWLLIASADYGADLAARAGDEDRSARYRALAAKARLALARFQPRPGQAEWYAIGRGGDGSLDFSLCPAVLARGAILGVLPASDPLLSSGLLIACRQLGFDRGLRAHARSATIDGGTPGYVLYAASDGLDSAVTSELALRMLRFCSATGCVWEFHDLTDTAWAGEKRRLWDSSVVLMGLVHALFELPRTDEGIEFVARPGLRQPALPAISPPFDAEQLLARSGPALLLHQRSPDHAARLARELLRHRNHQYAIGLYPGAPPADHSAIIISRSNPPAGWRHTPRGYWIRTWEGPPQLWLRNAGHVYRDTDPLLLDLFALLTPQRQQPLPFPDANFNLVARFGEAPSGQASLTATSGGRRASGRLDLSGGNVSLTPGDSEFVVRATPDTEHRRVLKLTVGAVGPRSRSSEITVTLPAGWWVVYARDMRGDWDRVEDPAREIRMADGRLQLVYSFRAGDQPLYITFHLARLGLLTPAP